MRAYLFWHARPEHVGLSDYEATLLRFGRALAGANSPGLLGHASYAIGPTPWLGEPGYEDWAWLDSSAALDALNDRAVTGDMAQPHDEIARATRHGGFGGLYYLVAGEHTIPGDSKIHWLTRPRGIDWRAFLPDIVGSANSRVTVWRRQMVLGPATEFAVVGSPGLALSLPEGWQSFGIDRRRVGQL